MLTCLRSCMSRSVLISCSSSWNTVHGTRVFALNCLSNWGCAVAFSARRSIVSHQIEHFQSSSHFRAPHRSGHRCVRVQPGVEPYHAAVPSTRPIRPLLTRETLARPTIQITITTQHAAMISSSSSSSNSRVSSVTASITRARDSSCRLHRA